MTLAIKTNKVPRNYSFGADFNGKERQEMLNQFSYLNEEDFNEERFVNYKGYWYDLSQFLLVDNSELAKLKWQGYSSDSFSSGVVVRYVEDDERIVMGTYSS